MRRFKSLTAILAGIAAACATSSLTPSSFPSSDFQPSQIKIGSFNIQVFGKSKREKEPEMSRIVELVKDYDIVAIQEVRDAKDETVPYLLNRLGPQYQAVTSPRLGRTNSKEQYAFVYRTDKVEAQGIDTVFEDSSDWFEREPHAQRFKSGRFTYVLVNIHIKPDDAPREIGHLVDVVSSMRSHYQEEDVITLGDFNADGQYFNEVEPNPFRTPEFLWLIGDDKDTTVAQGANTYDRIVIRKAATENDYAGSSDVERTDSRFHISAREAAKISDHHPIWALFHTHKDQD